MGHTPYGYKIEGGKAVIDEGAARQVRQIFEYYLDGESLTTAASKAGLKMFHGGVSRMLKNLHYLGDDYYPAIIDRETFDKVEAERLQRAESLGRIREPEGQEKIEVPVSFRTRQAEQKYDDPFQQAEYAYSLIESEG